MLKKLAAALAILALSVSVGVTPASADIAPAMFWCTAYKPHTGDNMGPETLNYYWFMQPSVVIARCYAAHTPGSPPHWYWVYVYSNGESTWAPKNQDSW